MYTMALANKRARGHSRIINYSAVQLIGESLRARVCVCVHSARKREREGGGGGGMDVERGSVVKRVIFNGL